MTTNYPGAVDSFTNPAPGDPLDNPSHAGLHADANDAIEAVQGELGATPSGSEATVAARLDKIEDGTRLGTNSVGATQIANDSVDTAAIQSKAVTAAKIADDTITAAQIAANAVGASELADNAVDTAAIADGAVTSAKIADGTIVDADINASAAIARSKISGLPTSSTDNTLPRFDSTGGALQTSGVVVDDNNRLTVPTGATAGYGFAAGAVNLSGTGAPEGAVTAPPGSTWLQTDSTTDVKGWIRWVKATGTGSTGWVAGADADTGWRVITPSPPTGWTSVAYAYVRRVGSRVELRLSGVTDTSGYGKLVTVPAGFHSTSGGSASGAWINTSSGGPVPEASMFISDSTDGVYVVRPTNPTTMFGSICYELLPTQAWPTSLPGTAL